MPSSTCCWRRSTTCRARWPICTSAGLRIVGADADAPLTVREADLRGPIALVVGSEGQGLGPAVRRRCDLLVRIPMRGASGRSMRRSPARSCSTRRRPSGDPAEAPPAARADLPTAGTSRGPAAHIGRRGRRRQPRARPRRGRGRAALCHEAASATKATPRRPDRQATGCEPPSHEAGSRGAGGPKPRAAEGTARRPPTPDRRRPPQGDGTEARPPRRPPTRDRAGARDARRRHRAERCGRPTREAPTPGRRRTRPPSAVDAPRRRALSFASATGSSCGMVLRAPT